MQLLKTSFQSIFQLFFPHNCTGCGSDVLANTEMLCVQCIENLPHTEFEKYPNNPIERIFIGRLNVNAATSGFYFLKGELMQTLIHDFKYKGNKEIGLYLSRTVAEKMLESNRFNHIDYIVPLPLFAKKEFKRGFNQAKIIADGMSEVLNVPVLDKNVNRIIYTETQTKKHRTERWDNVANSFTVTNPDQLKNKHILLVDDVITTGATLEACAQKMICIEGVKISLATLTTANK